MAYNPDGVEGHQGLGIAMQSIVSDVEGNFGLGFVLGTNVLLEVLDQYGNQVRRGTQYTLTVAELNGTVTSVLILHEPGVPYQDALPDGATVTLQLIDSAIYLDKSIVFQIQANGLSVQRVRFSFREAYFRITKKRFL